MKKVVIGEPLKGISTSGDYLVVEFDSGVLSIEKPRHVGLYIRPAVADSRGITVFVGAVFFMLVIGAFLDYFNQFPLSA